MPCARWKVGSALRAPPCCFRGERTGTVFSLGQPVRVKVQNVELTQCNIDLTLLTPLKGRTAGGQTSDRKRERDRMRGFNR